MLISGSAAPTPKITKATFLRVDVCRSDGTIIKHDVDIKALRRFSNAAKAVLPIDNTTRDADAANITYAIKPLGRRHPSDHAILGLLNRFEVIKHDNEPAVLRASDITGGLALHVDVLAACYALRVPFSIRPLEDDILKSIHDGPVTADQLAALWELLPSSNKLVAAIVQSLTHFYRVGEIETEHNTELEKYIFNDDNLAKRFDAEAARQKAKGGGKAR